MNPAESHTDLKLKSHLGKETGFQVTENYFEELNESIQWHIHRNTNETPGFKTMESGFIAPEGAPEKLTQQILQRIQEAPLAPDIPGLTQEAGFSIPSLYFERSTVRIPGLKKASYSRPLWKKYISIAAMILLGFGVTWWFQQQHNVPGGIAVNVPVQLLDSLGNEEIIPVLNEYELDEEVYAWSAQMPETQTKTAPAQEDSVLNSTQPIEDYLMEHIDELDEI